MLTLCEYYSAYFAVVSFYSEYGIFLPVGI